MDRPQTLDSHAAGSCNGPRSGAGPQDGRPLPSCNSRRHLHRRSLGATTRTIRLPRLRPPPAPGARWSVDHLPWAVVIGVTMTAPAPDRRPSRLSGSKPQKWTPGLPRSSSRTGPKHGWRHERQGRRNARPRPIRLPDRTDAPTHRHAGQPACSRHGQTSSSKGTRRWRNGGPSITCGSAIRSMRKCRTAARAGSRTTRYHSGGGISIAWGSTFRQVRAPVRSR